MRQVPSFRREIIQDIIFWETVRKILKLKYARYTGTNSYEISNSREFIHGCFYMLYKFSSSSIHNVFTASEGILQSPLGDRVTEPTLGPSGRQERLNCWLKKRR